MRWIRKTSASLLALALAACSNNAGGGPRFQGAGNTEPRRGGTLRIGYNDNVRTLDPAIAYDEYTFGVLHHLQDNLIGYEPAVDAHTGMKLVPQLAERWDIEAGGTLYRFHLRPGVTFSDGSPLVADDFVYALERVLREPTSPFQQFLFGIRGAAELSEGKVPRAAGIRAVDDATLEVELTEPDASILYILAMPFAAPQKRAHIESLAPDELRRRPLGTGPFVLADWSEGEMLVLERNERYWDSRYPYLDRIVILENVTRDTAFLQFLSGELDSIDRLSSADFIFVAQHPEWQPYLTNEPGAVTYWENLNCRRPPFTDVRVRRAMNYALDKSKQVKLQNGRAQPAHGALPPMLPGFNATLDPYPYDPVKARALLAEAGYPDGFRTEYVVLQDEQGEKMAQAIAADMAEVGIRVDIVLMSFPTFLQASGKGDLAFHYGAWFMDYPDPSNFLEVKFHSKMIAAENSNNDSFYEDPELDRLLDSAKRELDPDVRWALYRDVEALLYDAAPVIWNYHRNEVELVQPYLRNYHLHPVWLRDYRQAWLDLDADGKRVRR